MKKKSSHPFQHMQVCASVENFIIKQIVSVHTSFAGAWHTHFCDGGDDSVVPVMLANQVNYPFCDLFNGAPVQAVVVSRLKAKNKARCEI